MDYDLLDPLGLSDTKGKILKSKTISYVLAVISLAICLGLHSYPRIPSNSTDAEFHVRCSLFHWVTWRHSPLFVVFFVSSRHFQLTRWLSMTRESARFGLRSRRRSLHIATERHKQKEIVNSNYTKCSKSYKELWRVIEKLHHYMLFCTGGRT